MAFRCPRCGGSRFQSKLLSDRTLTRTCESRGCGFTWHEISDERYGLERVDPDAITKEIVIPEKKPN